MLQNHALPITINYINGHETKQAVLTYLSGDACDINLVQYVKSIIFEWMACCINPEDNTDVLHDQLFPW